jgi:hypothetical protein
MGRTIPSFRIVTVWEEEKWKLYRKYLRNKNEKRLFTNMFSIRTFYNFACSYAANPIRIYPIMMSIVLYPFYCYFYQMLLLPVKILTAPFLNPDDDIREITSLTLIS